MACQPVGCVADRSWWVRTQSIELTREYPFLDDGGVEEENRQAARTSETQEKGDETGPGRRSYIDRRFSAAAQMFEASAEIGHNASSTRFARNARSTSHIAAPPNGPNRFALAMRPGVSW